MCKWMYCQHDQRLPIVVVINTSRFVAIPGENAPVGMRDTADVAVAADAAIREDTTSITDIPTRGRDRRS